MMRHLSLSSILLIAVTTVILASSLGSATLEHISDGSHTKSGNRNGESMPKIQSGNESIAEQRPLHWGSFVSLPEKRTRAQAITIDRYVLVIGGIRDWENEKSMMPLDPILWISLSHHYAFYPLKIKNKELLTPIFGKSFAAARQHDVVIAYAASSAAEVSNKVIFVEMKGLYNYGPENGEEVVVTEGPHSLIPRRRATLVTHLTVLKPNLTGVVVKSSVQEMPTIHRCLYIVGGQHLNGSYVSQLEWYYNGVWSVIDTNVPDDLCECSTTSTYPVLIFQACVSCAHGNEIDEVFFFYPESGTFARSSQQWMQHGQSVGFLTLMYADTLFFEPHGNPVLALCNVLTNATTVIPTKGMDFTRKNCAVAVFGVDLLCLGGEGFHNNAGEITTRSDRISILNRPRPTMDRESGRYVTGEEVSLYSGESCKTETVRFALFYDFHCLARAQNISSLPCSNQEQTFNTAENVKLLHGETMMYFLCFTPGAVVNNEMGLCPFTSETAGDCLMNNCYWDDQTDRCLTYAPVTPENEVREDQVFWTAVSPQTIYFTLASDHSDAKNGNTGMSKGTLGMIAGGICGVLVIAILIVFNNKNSINANNKLGRKNSDNAVTVFGKNYDIKREIGSGSFGVVYLAERTSDGKQVAMKLIPCYRSKDRDAALQEYDIMRSLSHRNIIHFLEVIINWDGSSSSDRTAKSPTSPADEKRIKKKKKLEEEAAKIVAKKEKEKLSKKKKEEMNDDDYLVVNNNNNSLEDGLLQNDHHRDESNAVRINSSPHTDTATTMSYSSVTEPTTDVVLYSNDSQSSPPTDSTPPPVSIRNYSRFEDAVTFAGSTMPPRQQAAAAGDGKTSLVIVDENTEADDSAVRFMNNHSFSEIGSRFICIVSEYLPDGDLRQFALNYGMENKKSDNGGGGGGDVYTTEESCSISESDNVVSFQPIPEKLIVDISIQVFEALSHMHSRPKPIVHRDLKPENVLLDGNRVVVTDFGLSAILKDQAGDVTTQAGTLFCAAPETLKRMYGKPVDVWAGGCLIYALCTRRVSTHDARVMFADVDDEDFEESMRSDLKSYSVELQDIILAMLIKDPADRPTAEECRMALSYHSKSC